MLVTENVYNIKQLLNQQKILQLKYVPFGRYYWNMTSLCSKV